MVAETPSYCLVAAANLEPSEIQDLGDIVPQILGVKTKYNLPVRFRVSIEVGDGKVAPPEDAKAELNVLLENLKDGFALK